MDQRNKMISNFSLLVSLVLAAAFCESKAIPSQQQSPQFIHLVNAQDAFGNYVVDADQGTWVDKATGSKGIAQVDRVLDGEFGLVYPFRQRVNAVPPSHDPDLGASHRFCCNLLCCSYCVEWET